MVGGGRRKECVIHKCQTGLQYHQRTWPSVTPAAAAATSFLP